MEYLSQRIAVFFIVISIITKTAAQMPVIVDILWENTVIADVSHLKRSLDTMASLNNGTDVTILTHDVTGLSQTDLKTLVCNQASSGDTVFVSAVGCYLQLVLKAVVATTRAVVVATTSGCDLSTTPDPALPTYLPYPPAPPGLGPVMSDVIARLPDWRDVALLYDDGAASDVDNIMGAMTGTNTTLQAYRVRAQQDSDITAFFDTLLETRLTPRHIIIVCSMDCQLKVIREAQEYETTHNVQGHFTFDDRWLLVANRFELTALEDALGSIDNVAVLVPLTLSDRSAESVIEEVLSLVLRSLQVIVTSAVPFTSMTSMTSATTASLPTTTRLVTSCGDPASGAVSVGEDLQYMIQQMVCDSCEAYEVVTMMYVDGGRGSSMVATWSPSALTLLAPIFPNLSFGLNARHFMVSTNVWPPFVYQAAPNSSLPYEGLSIELLLELSRSANFTFNLTQPADGKWGGQVNGTWNGLVGQLQRKEVDVVVAPLSIQPVREVVMDYTEAYYNEYTTVLAKFPEDAATKWKLYISPFKWQVWLSLAGSIPFIGFLIWSFTKLSPYYAYHNQKSGLTKLDNAVLYAYGSFFTQGGIYLPTAQSGRFLVGFWWMYCIVVVATYSGNLIAFLTVSRPALPFNTLEEMSNQDDIKFGAMVDTAIYNELQLSRIDLLRSLWKRVQEYAAEDPEVTGPSHQRHIDKVLEGGYAYMNDKTGFDIAMSSHCEIQMIKESFLPLPYGVALQNQSAYERIFSREVVKVKEGGLITKWKQKWWPRQSFCSRGMVTVAKAVSLQDVQGAYYAAAILLTAAFLALLLEGAIKKCSNWMQRKNMTQEEPVQENHHSTSNGVAVVEGQHKEMDTWGIYGSPATPEPATVRDIYTNKEPMVDMFGRSTNKEAAVDLFSNGSVQNMVDLLGNPVVKSEKGPTVDKYGRVTNSETGERVDVFGRVQNTDPSEMVDAYGRTTTREPMVDMFGRSISKENVVDKYGRST